MKMNRSVYSNKTTRVNKNRILMLSSSSILLHFHVYLGLQLFLVPCGLHSTACHTITWWVFSWSFGRPTAVSLLWSNSPWLLVGSRSEVPVWHLVIPPHIRNLSDTLVDDGIWIFFETGVDESPCLGAVLENIFKFWGVDAELGAGWGGYQCPHQLWLTAKVCWDLLILAEMSLSLAPACIFAHGVKKVVMYVFCSLFSDNCWCLLYFFPE